MREQTSPVVRALTTVAALLVLAAWQDPPAVSDGRVSGLVGAAPARPLGNDVAPASGKIIEFTPLAGGRTVTTTSKADGRYIIELSPGKYEVRLSGYNPLQLYYGRSPYSYGEWPTVNVSARRETMLDLIFDSGIR